MSGRVVHFEVPYDDGSRAQAFYRDIFGWDTAEMPGLDYTLAMSGPSGDQGPTEPGYINGGMFKRDDGPTAGPVIVVDVEDIDATMQKIESLGGSAVGEKMAVGEMGWAAYFRDCEGNIMGLWQNS